MKGRGLLALGLLLALTTLVAPARAATRTVHLTANGPSPSSLALSPGDRVVFVNDDAVPHQVRSQGAWQFDSGPLPPRQTSAPTPVLNTAATYRYVDTRGVVVAPQAFPGSLVVRGAPKPSPTASPAPKPTRTSSPGPSRPSPGPVTAAPTPAKTAMPGPTVSAAPLPLPAPTASATPTPAPDIRYGAARSLVQDSPHRYGLPILLAVVAIAGVASLLGRYLLAQPTGRRTPS